MPVSTRPEWGDVARGDATTSLLIPATTWGGNGAALPASRVVALMSVQERIRALAKSSGTPKVLVQVNSEADPKKRDRRVHHYGSILL